MWSVTRAERSMRGRACVAPFLIWLQQLGHEVLASSAEVLKGVSVLSPKQDWDSHAACALDFTSANACREALRSACKA